MHMVYLFSTTTCVPHNLSAYAMGHVILYGVWYMYSTLWGCRMLAFYFMPLWWSFAEAQLSRAVLSWN